MFASNRVSGAPDEQQDLYRQCMATDYRNDAEPGHYGGSASLRNSNAEHQGEYEDGTYVRVSHQDVDYTTSTTIHPCCKTPCPSGEHYSTSRPDLYQSPAVAAPGGIVKSTLRALGLGAMDESEEFDGELILRKENEELTKRVADQDNQLAAYHREWRKQVEEKKRATAYAYQFQGMLRAECEKNQNTAEYHNSQIEVLTAKISEYKSIADGLNGKLSSLEQLNSKVVGSTGAHKDTPATPPNLEKSVFVVKEAAFACAKSSYNLLKEQHHEAALPNHLARVDERFRKYIVQARICSRMFAGFENDSFFDSLDCLPPDYENTEFFLRNQDLETRHRRYLYEYDELQKSGLQGVMEALKKNKDASTNPFLLLCCGKLVSTMTSLGLSFEECMVSENGDYLLYNLATNPRYCDKILKPFVNLAMATFLLHRLAFQFQPTARIFRYANGTRFDPTYLENVVFIDDDDSDKELYVGLMLVPGFQVGATIVKCTVYLVPSLSKISTPDSHHSN